MLQDPVSRVYLGSIATIPGKLHLLDEEIFGSPFFPHFCWS